MGGHRGGDHLYDTRIVEAKFVHLSEEQQVARRTSQQRPAMTLCERHSAARKENIDLPIL